MKKQFLGAYINFIPLFLVIFESANFYAHHYIYIYIYMYVVVYNYTYLLDEQ